MWYISRRINKLFKKKREKLFEAFHFDILNSQQPFKILNILDKNVKSWDSSRYTENRPDKYMRKLFFDMKENLTWKWAVWGMFDILQEKGLDEKNINYWI